MKKLLLLLALLPSFLFSQGIQLDIFTWVTIPDSKELTNFLTYYLGNLEGVNKTETFISLEVLKRGL